MEWLLSQAVTLPINRVIVVERLHSEEDTPAIMHVYHYISSRRGRYELGSCYAKETRQRQKIREKPSNIGSSCRSPKIIWNSKGPLIPLGRPRSYKGNRLNNDRLDPRRTCDQMSTDKTTGRQIDTPAKHDAMRLIQRT